MIETLAKITVGLVIAGGFCFIILVIAIVEGDHK